MGTVWGDRGHLHIQIRYMPMSNPAPEYLSSKGKLKFLYLLVVFVFWVYVFIRAFSVGVTID